MVDTQAGGLMDQLAQFYANNPGALALAVAEHRDDGRGRCMVCRSGGDSSGRMVFPCTFAASLQQVMTMKARKR